MLCEIRIDTSIIHFRPDQSALCLPQEWYEEVIIPEILSLFLVSPNTLSVVPLILIKADHVWYVLYKGFYGQPVTPREY